MRIYRILCYFACLFPVLLSALNACADISGEKPWKENTFGSHTGRVLWLTMLFCLVYSVLSFNPDPRIRDTFWSLTFGLAMTLLPLWGGAQYFVQRYLAIKTLKDAKR